MTHPGRSPNPRARISQRDSRHSQTRRPLGGPYRRIVSTSLDVRRDRFAKLVKRVVEHVRQTQGWTLTELRTRANVTKSTYYRWVNKTWTDDLEPSGIERFFDTAGWPVAEAWDILWPGKYGRREATSAPPLRPALEHVARALEDPNTSKEDLIVIEATLDMLLARLGGNAQQRDAR